MHSTRTLNDIAPSEQARRVQRRVLAVLSGAQIVGGIGIAVGFSIATLIAARLSGSAFIGGLASTCLVLGAALLALPTAWAAGRSGRRGALVFAYGFGVAGAVISVVAIGLGSWPLLLAGLVLFGGGSAANLSARYSASDLSPPGRSARHISIVIWAATVGTVTGPNLAQLADDLGVGGGLAQAAGPFALSAAAFGTAALIVFAGLRPDPLRLARRLRPDAGPQTSAAGPRSAWTALRASPRAMLALTAIAVVHTGMVSVMSMTPVHMEHHGATLSIVGLVISLHVVGMYMFSPLVGLLADRIGYLPVLALGLIQIAAASVVAATAPPHSVPHLSAGLALLGLGWSFGMIAGSALLTESVAIADRPGVQGLSDLAMNVAGAIGSVIAGAMVAFTSYAALGGGVAVLSLLALVWFLLRARAASRTLT
ncbi:MFS transporter [Rhizohabitans arisaemae]|uniref:MFS transporter n=1 Tax=Rhizohabitans arisaemae TaxID=2720610 RepID=UPI0024B1C113|nr:MFS transporter [Rhizohabitans arisaemae]